MNHNHPNFLLAFVFMLTALSGRESVAGSMTSFTAQPGGFLTFSGGDSRGGLIESLCARAKRGFELNCPPGTRRGPSAIDKFSAGLPHLRLNIILRDMRNVVVSGAGVDSLGTFKEPWATWKIVSNHADVTLPAPADEAYGLPVPPPGEIWDVPHANIIFQGLILNGCIGTPATFDLTLDSSVFRISSGEVFGDVHLVDSVQGYGHYNFKYKLRATDEAGNASDFIFSGDADSFCTAQPGI